MVMSPPPNILEVTSSRLGLCYPVTATTVVCCILMQILCVVLQKKLQFLGYFVPHTLYRGFAPGPRWGTSDPPVFFYVPPNNPVRLTPLISACGHPPHMKINPVVCHLYPHLCINFGPHTSIFVWTPTICNMNFWILTVISFFCCIRKLLKQTNYFNETIW